jgi:hypothetical protein
MDRVTIALAAGLALLAVAIGLTLLHSPTSVAGTNGGKQDEGLVSIRKSAMVCQAGEVLPRGTSVIVASLSTFTGPKVMAEALSGARVLTRGQLGSGWTGRTVAIPVKPLTRTVWNVKICFAFAPKDEAVTPYGHSSAPAVAATYNGKALPGRIRAEYLRPGSRSWWALVSSTAYHMGLGRAASGTWIVFLVIALMATVATVVSKLLLEELR